MAKRSRGWRGRAGLGLWLLLPALLAWPPVAGAGEQVTAACSPTTMLLMERVAKALAQQDPPLELSLSGHDSAQALQALMAGEAALATVSRPPTPLEEAQAQAKGKRLTLHQVATDCLLAVVHPNNPLYDLSLTEIQGIFSGRIRNWKEVGGKDKPIVVVVRPPQTGSAQVWRNKALDRTPPRDDAQMQETHLEVAQAVAGNKLAIGYISLGFLDPSVKALSLGGINPGGANVKAGRYPVCRPLLLVTAGKPEGPVKAVLDFLNGPAGRELVRELGFPAAK